MSGPRVAAVLGLLLVVASVAPAGVVAAVASSAETARTCETVATHDAFRFNEETINATQNGSGSSTVLNTMVRVEQNPAFVRVNATNPNGYCVRFRVLISPEVVSPAELGTIEATESNQTASWRAVRDFNRSVTYTEVTFVLPAGTQASFAPAKARVAALKWTGTATSAGSELFGNYSIPLIGGEHDLQQRTYTFSPETNGTTIITVPLTNRSSGRSIREYQALYRTPTQDWVPVSTDSTAPVFKRELDGDAVQFQFNNPDATVKFTANPNTVEKAQYQWDAYWGGVEWFSDYFGQSDSDRQPQRSSSSEDDGGWWPLHLDGGA